ncbi:MAG: hypothetical protein GWN58_55725 [Anaerolineae bacterium]|nr:hypothetical protein [Anaerolineae bacterium]
MDTLRKVLSVWRKRLFTIGLILGLALFLRQVWVTFKATQHLDLASTKPVYLLAAFAANLSIYALMMLAWPLLMRYLGASLSIRHTVQGYCLTFIPRYIPGSVWGYLSRSQWLEQAHGISFGVSLMGSVLEGLGFLLTGLVVAGLYLSSQLAGTLQLLVVLACLALLLATWLIVPRIALQLGRRLSGGTSVLPQGRHAPLGAWLAAIALYLLLWVAFGASLLFAGNALLPNPANGLPTFVFVASLSWVLGFVIVFVPAGLGIRELAISTLLTAYAALLPWQADLVAVLSRFGLIIAELAWLLVGLALFAGSRSE